MHYRANLVLLMTFVILPSELEGRLMQAPASEELERRATVVCVATPIEVQKTEVRGKKTYRQEELPTVQHRAILRIIATRKGQAPPSLEFRYWKIDWKVMGGVWIKNGPWEVGLSVGQKYPFYLTKADNASYYVSVLDGQYDDGPAVVPLTDLDK